MERNYHFNVPFPLFKGRDYCHMGNGLIRTIIQLGADQKTNNAVLLNVLPPDSFNAWHMWYLYHHEYGVVPSCVAFNEKGSSDFYVCDTRQIDTGTMRYAFEVAGDIPMLKISYDLEYILFEHPFRFPPGNLWSDLTGRGFKQKKLAAIEESIYCPIGSPVVIREVTIIKKYTRKPLQAWFVIAPNKLLLPDGKFSAKDGFITCGDFTNKAHYLGIKCLQSNAKSIVTAFPDVYTRLARKTIRAKERQMVRLPFDGIHAACGGTVRQGRTITFALSIAKTQAELAQLMKRLDGSALEQMKEDTRNYYAGLNYVKTRDKDFNILFDAAKAGIRASVSADVHKGRMNSGLLWYDSQWGRDQDFVTLGAILSGQLELAKDSLVYMLEKMTTSKGRCSAGECGWEGTGLDAQIDMNGMRLYVLWTYLVYTGDESLIKKYWDKIVAMAELPLEKVFLSPETKMLIRARDCWERLHEHGLVPGYELYYQLWHSIGLEKASRLARLMRKDDKAKRWETFSEAIWNAVMNDAKFKLIEKGHFVKRKTLDGKVQHKAVGYRGAKVGYLEPDAVEIAPIMFDKIDPYSRLATNTIKHVKKICNQDGLWDNGGYARYNVTSDPEGGITGMPASIPNTGPWPGINIWVARAAFEAGMYEVAMDALRYVKDVGEPTYTLFEHQNYEAKDKSMPTFYCGGIVPWLAYGEPAIMYIYNFLGFKADLNQIVLKPNVPPQLGDVRARVNFRGNPIDIKIHFTSKKKNARTKISSVTVDGEAWEDFTKMQAIFPHFNKPTNIKISLKVEK